MKLPGATIVICITFICLTNGRAGDQRAGNSPISIFDSKGNLVPSSPAAPSAKTVDVDVGPSGASIFSPNSLTIVTGDTVRWTWKSSFHTVTSGSPCTADSAYCSPTDTNCTSASTSNSGAIYTHTFTQAGTFHYFCAIHCFSGMTGTVTVLDPFVKIMSVTRDSNGFTITGKTTPNTTITVKSAPDLASEFQNPTTATSNASGDFTLTDGSATSAVMRFYKATYP